MPAHRTLALSQTQFVVCTIQPGEWQEHVNDLLRIDSRLHGTVYQTVPDRTRGDRGLEGFTRDGHAIQAYADIQSRNADERKKGQRKKILNDLKKLEEYSPWWEQTLAGVKLHNWSLLVPILDDANIVQYARTKGLELREKNLPFIADDFQAFVQTDQDYPRALSLITNPALAYRMIKPRPVADNEIAEFAESTPRFVTNMDRKVRAYMRSLDPKLVVDECNQQLQNHLLAANYLDDLEIHFPSDWEAVVNVTSTLADSTGSDNRASISAPHQRIKDLQREFIESLKNDIKDMPTDRQRLLANGLVGKWLGDCTLEFYPAEQQ